MFLFFLRLNLNVSESERGLEIIILGKCYPSINIFHSTNVEFQLIRSDALQGKEGGAMFCLRLFSAYLRIIWRFNTCAPHWENHLNDSEVIEYHIIWISLYQIWWRRAWYSDIYGHEKLGSWKHQKSMFWCKITNLIFSKNGNLCDCLCKAVLFSL